MFHKRNPLPRFSEEGEKEKVKYSVPLLFTFVTRVVFLFKCYEAKDYLEICAIGIPKASVINGNRS